MTAIASYIQIDFAIIFLIVFWMVFYAKTTSKMFTFSSITFLEGAVPETAVTMVIIGVVYLIKLYKHLRNTGF